jgi:LPXTG-motif cell wall-anchored protein
MLPANGSATVDIPFDVPTTQQYQFKILDDSNSSNVYLSPAFKIYPPISGTSPTSTATSPTATTGSTSSTSTSTKRALSTGVIVGISVGVAGGLLFLIGIAFFFVRRRRKHKTWMQEHQQQAPPEELAPPYDMNHQYDPTHMQQQQQQPQTIEVPGSRSWPREMEAESRFQQREVVELPAEPVEGYSGLGKK